MGTKAVFFDIDGTLVSLKTKTACESTRRALSELRSHAIRTFVATGRSQAEIVAQRMLDGMEFDGILSNNGQYCYHGSEVLFSAPIAPEDVAAVVAQAEERNYSAWFVEADRTYMNHIDDRVRIAMRDIHTEPPALADIHRALQHPIYKIVLFLTPEEMQEYPLRVTHNCMTTAWHPFGSDLMPKGGGKLGAVRKVLARYGIAQADTMAFGDGENDLEMLRFAGIGVAMANAAPCVKEIADFTTGTCEEDGIYNALVHFGWIGKV
jgi:Cof subfamily protein (haloacid dehalogenase superfamily)